MKRLSPRRFWLKFTEVTRFNELSKPVRKVVIAIMGGSVLLVGVLMLVTPGPAVLVIPLGLAILATEFLWAKRWMLKAQDWFRRACDKARQKRDK